MDDLIKAHKIAAQLVKLYGDKYFCIFNRIYEEIEKARISEYRKSIALEIAWENKLKVKS